MTQLKTPQMQVPRIALFLVLCILSSATFAQSTPPAGSGEGAFSGLLENITGAFTYVVDNSIGAGFADAVKNSALGLAARTQTVAYSFAGILALISIFWKGMLTMLERKSIIAPVMEVLIYSSVAVAVIANYTVFVEQIWDIATALLNAIAGAGGVGAALGTYISTFFGAVGTIFRSISDTWASVGFWQATTMMMDMLGSVILLVGICIMMIMASVEIIGVFVMGPVFFAVGIVFGPIMIATLASDFTRKWFDQWLNFLISSAMLTTVAVTVLMLLSATAGAAASRIAATPGGGFLALIGLGILTMSLSKLFSAVPAITDAIFPGRTGAGSAIAPSGGASALAAAAIGATGLGIAARAAANAPGQAANAVITGLNAKSNITASMASAGASVATMAKQATNAVANFGGQVGSSDAAKGVENIYQAASASGASAGNQFTGGGNTTPDPFGSMEPGSGARQQSTSASSSFSEKGGSMGRDKSGPGFSDRQLKNIQEAFNNRSTKT